MIVVNIYNATEFKKILSLITNSNNKQIFKCSFVLSRQYMKWEFSNYVFKFKLSVSKYSKNISGYYTFDIMMFQNLIQPLSEISIKIDSDLNKMFINELEISLFKLDENNEPSNKLKYENATIINTKLFDEIDREHTPKLYLIHSKLYLILIFKHGTEFVNKSIRIINDKFVKNFKTIVNRDTVSILQNLNIDKLKIYTDNIQGIKFKCIFKDFNFQILSNQ